MAEHAPRSRCRLVMNEHSFLVEDQKFIAPIRCSECDDNAPLIRRAPHPLEGLEIRTFECQACGHQMERIVTSEDRLPQRHAG
jgi:Zn ribbon nucleic-acid-binding protein